MSEIHVSLDLETLSTRPDAAILSIGAAARVNDEVVTFSVYCNSEQVDRHVDTDTLEWWSKQGDLWTETLERSRQAAPLSEALAYLKAWIAGLGNDQDRLFIWGNGASFDVAILEHAYKASGCQPPWAYWIVRDLRTLKHLAQATGQMQPVTRKGTHHDAGTDAVNQLEMIETWWQALTA